MIKMRYPHHFDQKKELAGNMTSNSTIVLQKMVSGAFKTILSNLPRNVVNAKDVNVFKVKLDNHWEHEPWKYNHEA